MVQGLRDALGEPYFTGLEAGDDGRLVYHRKSVRYYEVLDPEGMARTLLILDGLSQALS